MRSALVLLALLGLVSAARIPRTGHVVHERRDVTPSFWSRAHRIQPDIVLPMRIGLKQNNVDKLEDMLMDVSHPDSPNYGNHWSPAKVAATFAPSRETIETVKNWLQESGIDASRMRLSRSKGWIEFNATASEIEGLLDAEYHVYTHDETGREHICWSIPIFIYSKG